MLSKLYYIKLYASLTKKFTFKHNSRNCATSTAMATKKTIQELGYVFNADGQLRKIGENGEPTQEPFVFNISKEHHECQAHYEELGNAVTDYIYHILETKVNLIKLPVPKHSTDQSGTFIFVSKDYDKKDVLMVLIHGSGVVRAGQWARSLIINESIEMGSQIAYIKRALGQNYGVMVLNTNDNFGEDGNKIQNSGSSEDHAIYVWNTYISRTNASSIVIVAHSYGGVVTVTLADKVKVDFEKRVKAIAFTDSVHGYSVMKVTDFMKRIAKNWISCSSPLDTPMKTPDYDIARVSAGHPKHEMTSYTCIDSVFKFIQEALSKQ